MFDLAPEAVAAIFGDRLPAPRRRAYRRFRQGPARSKSTSRSKATCRGPTPRPGRAGTVHVVGSFAELAATERDIARRTHARAAVRPGRPAVPRRPERSVGNMHPLWTYAHVPNGYSGDATEAIIAQIERFAPGFRDRIVGQDRPHHDATGGLQPELRRRRHHDRRQGHPPTDLRAPDHPVALQRSAFRACTSALRPPRRARAPTACAAPTPPTSHFPNSGRPTTSRHAWRAPPRRACGRGRRPATVR